MNYINVLLAKINHFNSKMTDSNYSDIRSFYHSNYSSTKFHIHFSPSSYTHVSLYLAIAMCSTNLFLSKMRFLKKLHSLMLG